MISRLTIIAVLVTIGAVIINSCSNEARSIADELEMVVETQGIDAAAERYIELRDSKSDRYDFGIDQLESLAAKLHSQGNETAAIRMLELNTSTYEDSARTFLSLAKGLHNIGRQEEALVSIETALDLDPLWLETIIMAKRLRFVPVEFDVPERIETENFVVRPIQESDAELDFKAIMSSLDHLQGVLGRRDWPSPNMTLEEDRYSLKMHQNEFERREAFVYTVMNRDESECLGCVYFYPSRIDSCDTEIVMWVSSSALAVGFDDQLYAAVRQWLEDAWPFKNPVFPGREITWGEFFELLDRQDQKYHQ